MLESAEKNIAPHQSDKGQPNKKSANLGHAAVREVERDDGLELLGGHGFSRVRVEGGRRLIEKDGIFELQGSGGHGVSETDIDLDRDDGGSEFGRVADAKSAMGAVLAERCREDVFGIEAQSVVRDRLSADIANCLEEGRRLTVSKGEQVEVAGRSERILEPGGVEHGALEDEELLVRRDTEAKEKPFKGISGQHALEIGLLLPGEVLQPRAYGSGDIPRFTRHRRPPFPDRAAERTRCGYRGRSRRSAPAWPCRT